MFWLPIKLEIIPCIIGWLRNSKRLWPGPPIKPKIDEQMMTKILLLHRNLLDALAFISSITNDESLKKKYFLNDNNLRN